ncbi:hypothetical protein VTN49DRAFT_108 [Thermomyces lanuginosus]|uniref:uncharacterized protein n=1 Tax=Thermomyces lanuginosus TaxID=5541 RepID=UPI0037430C5E
MVCRNRVLTALDLHALTRCTRQFPCQPKEICIVKDKVVMVGVSRNQRSLIYIWDLRTYQVHGIGSVGEPFLWHVDVDGNVLVIFEINWSVHPLEVQESKWTLNGKLLDRKCIDVSLSGRRLGEIRVLPAMDLHHSKYRTFGHKTVSRLFPEMFGKATMDLVYDHAVDKLAIRYDCTQSFKSIHDLNFYQTLTPYIAYQWNSSVRKLEITNVASGTITMRPYQPDVREVRTLRALQQPQRQASIDFYGPPLFPFGDSEVLGLVSYDGIQLWFFNPSFLPDVPDAVPFLPTGDSG